MSQDHSFCDDICKEEYEQLESGGDGPWCANKEHHQGGCCNHGCECPVCEPDGG